MRIKYLLIIFCFIAYYCASAQEISFKDTIAAYNLKRITLNKKGMEVLGAWGIANIAAGSIGYFSAKQDEWKYFHEMNIAWGAVNTGIAIGNLFASRREIKEHYNAQQAYTRYKTNKKVYLINAGLDVLYIGVGAGLYAYGDNANKHDADIFHGFGRSVTIQGVMLLLFDNIMFAAQQRNNANWFHIMNEIQLSGTRVGWVHPF